MIFYSNTESTVPHLVFIGRWSPFHKGHVSVIMAKRAQHPRSPVLIMVRERKSERYSAAMRARYIRTWMRNNGIAGTIMIIPDISGVYWGRNVGYETGYVDVDAPTREISGSSIRKRIQSDDRTWAELTADAKSSGILSPRISDIIERGLVVWLTGCPGSGKTTISDKIVQRVRAAYPYLPLQQLDGDVVRDSPLARGAGFSKKDRAEHIARMAYVAGMLADRGTLVICSFVSPDERARLAARRIIGAKRFLLVAVRASLATRKRRDTKGLYGRAEKGEVTNLTGFNAPYDEPRNPDLVCDTDRKSADKCAAEILARIFPKTS